MDDNNHETKQKLPVTEAGPKPGRSRAETGPKLGRAGPHMTKTKIDLVLDKTVTTHFELNVKLHTKSRTYSNTAYKIIPKMFIFWFQFTEYVDQLTSMCTE